jgi:ectoine hydroxylase-related dioxygenase (phytanoyl-CoA dioxygenase family)
MTAPPLYDDRVGWVRVDRVLDPATAADLARDCHRIADQLTDPRSGDKPHGATRRLTALDERLPATSAALDGLAPVVDQILVTGWTVTEIGFRCPEPGTGAQKLHADDVPRLVPGPHRGATAIVALVDFTADNGATRVVAGSHLRPDLQRQSQQVDHLPGEEYLLGGAGTGFVFTRHLLHAGSSNRSEDPRPALQISFTSTAPAASPDLPSAR